MFLRGTAVKVAMLVATIVAGLVVGVPAASAKQAKAPVFWIDLAGTAKAHPDFVFFTGNAGPQVRHVKWKNWGKAKTVARGHYMTTSPPIPGEPSPAGPAKIVAWKKMSCVPEFGNKKGKRVFVYRHAKMLRPVPGGGRKWTNISDYTGRVTCK